MIKRDTHVPAASSILDAVWKKSSYSGSNEGQCVEVADVRKSHASIAVRDSKVADGPALLLEPTAFATLIASLRRDIGA
ncbi:DUF397 domain-containing protein [Streptomyces sp. NPDC046685]|uniref:DUF397 domain-containing protein n=1 Tax=Streptomyces sp. NPDC046685 TaxID=3157202 RepID=UPI0033D36EB8